MSQQLTNSQFNDLSENFRIESDKDPNMFALSKLRDEQFLCEVLEEAKVDFDTNNLFIAASQFIKRIGFLIVAPTLYNLTKYNQWLSASWTNQYIIPRVHNNQWIPNLYLDHHTVTPIDETSRKKLLKQYLEQLFTDISTLIENVSSISRVPKPILWENIAVYIYWLYEVKLSEEIDEDIMARVHHDFRLLIYELEAKQFQESFQPLKRFHGIKRLVSLDDDPIRIRRTCCFYYEVNVGHNFCNNCPKSELNKAACRATKDSLYERNMVRRNG
ncbi:ferric iron reductase protein FhuF [Alkalibacillus filiformis]|uniref:Ferric iron reductase protein FhuF n=1 Tax=Alkalibacillus filiformis TaxID=200990 RepID=A0ABU0DP36_9BACI|nr:(2Fe-2S)-binding protein [Alkalibacillus filiformis]MDQ0350213.1 ferric iron reductase protein FhuF [Alkalibacillus filiformis]